LIGKVTQDYVEYSAKEEIGHGGFGRIYKLNDQLAVKEEHKVIVKLFAGV